MKWFGRIAALAIASSTLVALAACDDYYDDGYYGHGRRSSCAQPVRQCQTLCTNYCDAWGYCYPYCYDSCWSDCADDGSSSSSSGGTPVDASVGPTDASLPVTYDAGPPAVGAPLCSPCATNDECQAGALCIFYGVPSSDAGDAGSTSASFCGSACTGTCPTGFTCATLGKSQQCVPTNGRCQ